MLRNKTGLMSALRFTIDESVQAGNQLPKWKVVHKRRESNSVAHEVAQLAKLTGHSVV
jgi:hypothetical protein